ncbi:MAG: hypothetical protein LQ342_000634 [Letrouitia transgressa]|nr:MAG: hypothetical protein LQ342_000634 [Letrouitia transgressa]
MSSSGLSDLSSPLSTDDELASATVRNLDHYFKSSAGVQLSSSPPAKKKRPPSPPHEYVLADNADIAFICMFRSRFHAAFPRSLPHLGPQDIEQGVVDSIPSEQVEKFLCALIGLVLNRKKDVERGHYQRALEEAVQTHANQWPSKWQSKNPLHGGGNFNNMNPAERLTLLTALILWSLGSSEVVQTIIKDSYKQQRHDDDLNQPLSVQPWGRDGDKRRYWLIEGQDDTHFRLYRESNPALKHITWRSVAGNIEELKNVANNIGEDGTQASRRLKDRVFAGVPRFEAGEERRKRRDYRNARKAQFARPDPGFSYEGRTRGKRVRYTFSDEDEIVSDAVSTRRSNRHSRLSTPAEPAQPTVTARGRQIRSRVYGAYGETITSAHEDSQQLSANGDTDANENTESQQLSLGRPQRTAYKDRDIQNRQFTKNINGYESLGELDDESDTSSGEEWNGGDENESDDNAAEFEDEDDEEMNDSISANSREGDSSTAENDRSPHSLVVSLRYLKHQNISTEDPVSQNPPDSHRDLAPSQQAASWYPQNHAIVEPAVALDVVSSSAQETHQLPIANEGRASGSNIPTKSLSSGDEVYHNTEATVG